MRTLNKEIGELVKQAEKQGWTAGTTKKNHVKLVSPSGAVVITSSTPSDVRSVRNFASVLKRHGFIGIKGDKK